jgi:hypothetical protein
MYLRGDAARDGLALVEAAHNGDWEGAKAVLANCDCQMVCGFLGRLAADLVEELSWLGDVAPEGAFARLREIHGQA